MRVITLRVLSLVAIASLVEGTNVEKLKCSRGNVRHLDIQGCDSQPCAIRKGQHLPFELELSFTHPADVPAQLHYTAFTPYYSAPPKAYGEVAAKGDCSSGGLGFECPLRAGQGYTIKSQLYIEPNATCATQSCNNSLNQLVDSFWIWNAYLPGDDSKGSAFCQFKVVLNVMP